MYTEVDFQIYAVLSGSSFSVVHFSLETFFFCSQIDVRCLLLLFVCLSLYLWFDSIVNAFGFFFVCIETVGARVEFLIIMQFFFQQIKKTCVCTQLLFFPLKLTLHFFNKTVIFLYWKGFDWLEPITKTSKHFFYYDGLCVGNVHKNIG